VLATVERMATKKKPGDSDRHKPSRMVRVPAALAAELEKYASEQFNSLTEEVKAAVREYLEKRGRLPKQGPPPARPRGG
jgi:hypothetical protein